MFIIPQIENIYGDDNDPFRIKTLHCLLYPETSDCKSMLIKALEKSYLKTKEISKLNSQILSINSPNNLDANNGHHTEPETPTIKDKMVLTDIMNDVEDSDSMSEEKIIHLKNLEDLLNRMFRNEQITISDLDLNYAELHILVEILMRKNRKFSFK